MRSLAVNMLKKGRMETTVTRAKAVRPVVEHAITIAKKDTLASRRILLARLGDKAVVTKLFQDIAPRYKERNGGYTRIVRTGKLRKRDGVEVAFIEFV